MPHKRRGYIHEEQQKYDDGKYTLTQSIPQKVEDQLVTQTKKAKDIITSYPFEGNKEEKQRMGLAFKQMLENHTITPDTLTNLLHKARSNPKLFITSENASVKEIADEMVRKVKSGTIKGSVLTRDEQKQKLENELVSSLPPRPLLSYKDYEQDNPQISNILKAKASDFTRVFISKGGNQGSQEVVNDRFNSMKRQYLTRIDQQLKDLSHMAQTPGKYGLNSHEEREALAQDQEALRQLKVELEGLAVPEVEIPKMLKCYNHSLLKLGKKSGIGYLLISSRQSIWLNLALIISC